MKKLSEQTYNRYVQLEAEGTITPTQQAKLDDHRRLALSEEAEAARQEIGDTTESAIPQDFREKFADSPEATEELDALPSQEESILAEEKLEPETVDAAAVSKPSVPLNSVNTNYIPVLPVGAPTSLAQMLFDFGLFESLAVAKLQVKKNSVVVSGSPQNNPDYMILPENLPLNIRVRGYPYTIIFE